MMFNVFAPEVGAPEGDVNVLGMDAEMQWAKRRKLRSWRCQQRFETFFVVKRGKKRRRPNDLGVSSNERNVAHSK